MGAVWAQEVTPALTHEIVQQVAREIDAQAMPIEVKRSTRTRPVGNCYWNVDAAMQESGGSIVLGWAVMWWPQIYGVAMHHAVWQMPSGRLIDVTEPQPPDKTAKHTIFVPDNRFEVSLFKPPCIDNIIVPLSADSSALVFAGAYKRKQAIRREIVELSWEIGQRCEENFALAAGVKYIPPDGVSVTEDVWSRYRRLETARAAADREVGAAIEALLARPK